ncbi:MAG: hypothetical protein ACOYL3_07985 [Desulfuromonadaceae bacterium]
MKKTVTLPENPNTPRTESQAALEWNRSKAWFQRKRWEGGGPEYIKLPGKRGGVLYPPEGLRRYFTGFMCKSTSESSIR